MAPYNPFSDFAFGELLDTALPDFVLAFAFFTAVTYAVLGRRFGQQRPAIAMSAALGLALSIGLVWWEYERGWSIRNLGPVAVGFAIIVLGMVMHQAIKQVGGTWAGAGIALGASLLVGWILGFGWPVDRQIIQTIIGVTLTVGILAFLLHSRGLQSLRLPVPVKGDTRDVRHDMRDLYDDVRVNDKLKKGFHQLRKKADHLPKRPEEASDIMVQLRKMLPAEGWLTERMAQLRAKAHRMRQGHVARIEEIQAAMAKLPPQAKKKAAQELIARYKELKLDLRLERLDKAVAANEQKIRQFTRRAQEQAQARDHQGLHDTFKAAEKFQKHNSHLFSIIERTERRLSAIAENVAKQTPRVSRE